MIEPKQLKNWFWIQPFELIDIIRDKDYKSGWLISYKQFADESIDMNYNVFWEEIEHNEYQNPHGMKLFKWRFSADSEGFLSDFVVNLTNYDITKTKMHVYYEIKGESLWWNAVNKLAQGDLNLKIERMFERLIGIIEEQWGKKLEWEANVEQGLKRGNIGKGENVAGELADGVKLNHLIEF